MYIDYTELFQIPDELADFCMLDKDEQERIIADLAAKGQLKDTSMTCKLYQNIKIHQ